MRATASHGSGLRSQVRWRRSSGGQDSDDRVEDAPASGHVRPLDRGLTPADGRPSDDPASGDGDRWATPGDIPVDDAGDGTGADAEAEPAAAVTVDVPMDLGEVDPDDLARAVRRAVARALAEDLGDRGDLTSLATVPPGTTGVAEFVARGPGVVAGTDLVRAVFEQVDARVEVDLRVADGDSVALGDVLGTVSGPLRSILTGERTALNFLCHLSGVATRTRAFVDAVAGTGCAIRDTRKTTPGLRLLEKAAVRAGGGHNHRVGLHDAILVKDNHVAAAGSVTAATERALRRDDVHVQVEVTDLQELEEALRAGATDILVDNFSPEQVRQAIQRVEGRAALEASGAITLDNVRRYAGTGVGRVAVGAITHSAPNLDIALDLRVDELEAPRAVVGVWSDTRDVGEVATVAAGDTDTDQTSPDETAADESAVEESPAEAAAADEAAPDDDVSADDASEDRSSDDVSGDTSVLDVAAARAVEDLHDDESEPEATVPEPEHADEPADEQADDPADEPASEDGLFAWRARQLGSDGRD